MSLNKITYGLRNLHIAFEAESGAAKYDTPIKVLGVISWSPSPEGDTSSLFADDITYHTINANTGYSADLETANISDEVISKMLGWKIDKNGALIETADAVPRKFALMAEVQGDVKNRRFVYYDVQANRPSKTEQTKKDSVEPNPTTMPVRISPVEINGELIVKADLELNDVNKAVYDSFFTKVYQPDYTAIV